MISGTARPRRCRRFQSIATQIEAWLTGGTLSAGDRLPSERRLAAMLKVSRSSVREALRILEEKGRVQIRRGRKGGAFLTPAAPLSPPGAPLPKRLEHLTDDQIADFRRLIEGHVAALASESADAPAICLLNRRLATARSWLHRGSAGVAAYLEADKAVHIAIAQIAGHGLFFQALESALGIRSYFDRFLQLRPDLMETNYRDLTDIVRAIENGRPEAARIAATAHITRFNDAFP